MTALEVLRPLAVPTAVVGGFGVAAASFAGGFELYDASLVQNWNHFWTSGAKACWATAVIAGGVLGASALIAHAKEQ